MRHFLPPAVLALALLVVGCAGGARTDGGDAPPAFPDDYRRVVAPSFPVLDSTGQPFTQPFYGGLNVPRPQFADVDGDGDQDLFIQERTGELAFFEHVADGDSMRYVWRTDHFQNLEVGEWTRFADLDQDGDPDLLAERPYSYIRVFRNESTEAQLRFTRVVDSLRMPGGKPIFSDRQNIPNVTDIDCNGRLDLFLGKLDGTIARYEATDATGIPRFQKVTEQFEGIEIVNQQMMSARHGANTLTFADVDGDGDEDLFWGDFFEPGLLLIENTGSCSAPDLTGDPEPFPPSDPLATSGYNAPAVTDWGNDGDPDLFVGVLGGAFDANTTLSDNFHFFRHTADGFTHETGQFLGALDTGSESTVAMGDLDGDGDLDGLVANKIDPRRTQTARVYLLENTGAPTAPSYQLRDALDGLPAAYHFAPALGDLDDDGTPDLILGTWGGSLLHYTGNGDGSFTKAADPLLELPRGSNAMPALGDLDDDGDLDLVVGESAGTLTYYRNDGSPTDPAFTLVSEAFADLAVDNRSAPALHDVDRDGDLDLLVGSETDGFVLARNTGTPSNPQFADARPVDLDAPRLAAPTFADVNGDGSPDLVAGSDGGGLVLFLSN
jgi:hypothetical protein